ncbi:MAG: glutamate--tRNA ligase [Marinomonas sp.]|uniref:glutamate--tRNA ligase n=1 Tax=unclassified Marinomonas TaxID=196814 RepID=UPI0007AF517B|nr:MULTISPECIES: glutamate--tRNA ligase [unclassified Marinomonas]KZM41550.1 glutamyl-tRNA synthetase [Marinomonas sp. SBI22]KZM43386.1 glutamyl-tRNA synthetase [Marinomonas sp. SBI8L]
MSEIRTRIAPSPTGDPHVGTAYIALFNMAFARKMGGKFILRIEDTDQTRSTPESEKMILDALRWLGLDWAEGPDVGGEYGPYRQSERGDIYADYAKELIEKGHAFYAFETAEELDQMRNEQREQGLQPKYDGRALKLSQEEVQAKLDAGVPYVIRMKIPEEGICRVQDMLRGEIEIDWAQVDMQVLLKADGMPTYHLANVVDDHLMKITHVIRGEEWINSAPKHILLYQYFGWDMPTLCHMPLLRNPDKSKLSKRKNPTSILYYQRMGYLAEAVVNYLGRMGWSMPDEREKFSLDDMIEHFDIQRVSLGGPVFDVEKLSWLNGLWIREDLNPQAFAQKFQEWALNPEYLMQILPLITPRIEKFSDVADVAGFFLKGHLDINASSFDGLKLEDETLRKALQFATWKLESLSKWEKDEIFNAMKSLAQTMEIKPKDFFAPLFVAIAGTTSSVSVFDSMAILGPDISRARLRAAVNAVGSPSKKEGKRWEKEFQAL